MSTASTAETVLEVVDDRNVPVLAAGFAYYAFSAVIPGLILVLIVGTILGGQSFARALVEQLQGFLTGEAQRQLTRSLLSGVGRTGFGLVSVLLVLYSVFKLLGGLDVAFNEIYELHEDPSRVGQLKNGVLALALIAAAIAMVVGIGFLLGLRSLRFLPYPQVVGAVALLVGLTVVFLPLYYVMPPVEMHLDEALPGTVLAAAGWVALQVVFHIYVTNVSQYAAYGLLGGVILFVTWLYVGGFILLLGATVNFVLEYGRAENRLAPAPEV